MFVIAEVGSNIFKHKAPIKNLSLAFDSIAAATEAGADAIKFQMFTSQELFGEKVDAIDRWSLPRDWIPDLYGKCLRHGIEFLCSGFSVDGYKYLDKFVDRHKVASPEALAGDIVDWCWTQQKQVIWSNGCTQIDARPFDVVLNCVTAYPAQAQNYSFDPPHIVWGISDHTLHFDAAIRAKEAGGLFFEKHVDFFPSKQKTPDSRVSIDGSTFARYVATIKSQYPVEDADLLRKKAARLYGRKYNGRGWFRPLPVGVD